MNHTPGPWACGFGDNGVTGDRAAAAHYLSGVRGVEQVLVRHGCEVVAIVAGYHRKECIDADANLIAAAPDLLAVAYMVLEKATIETPLSLINAASDAIAKARGQV